MPAGKKGLFKLKKSASAPNINLEWTKHDEKLLHEVEQAHKEKVESLIIKKGLNPTKLNVQGRSAFHEAASRGQQGILQIFLSFGADVQAADAQGRTALHVAARHGRTEVLYKLIQAGISVCSIDLCQMMPIHHACLGGHLPCVQVLITKESPLNAEDKDKRTPLFFAAEMGEASVCRELIDNGVNVNAQDVHKRTALMLAAHHGHKDVVDLFVKRGANVRLTDEQGHNAARFAVEAGHDAIKQIIDEAPAVAAWDLSAPEDEDNFEQEEKRKDEENEEHTPAYIPDDDNRVDFIAQFTVDDSPSPVAVKREANLGEIILPDDENAASSHESYLEIQRTQDVKDQPDNSLDNNKYADSYRELEEEHEALNEEYKKVKSDLKKLGNLNTELQRRLESRTPPPTELDNSIIEALENEISELKDQLKREKTGAGGRKTKQGLDDSWNDSEDDLAGGEETRSAPQSRSNMDKHLVPMLRSQILTLQRENERLKNKVKKVASGELDLSSDDEGGISSLNVDILNGDSRLPSSHNDTSAQNKRIRDLEEVNKQHRELIKELQKEINNNTGRSDERFTGEGKIDAELFNENETLKTKIEGLRDLVEALENTSDQLRSQNEELENDVVRLKSDYEVTAEERDSFHRQLQEIANFGGEDEEETDVLKFFQDINSMKRDNAELRSRNEQLEDDVEQLLKQKVQDGKLAGVIPEDSAERHEVSVEEVIFSAEAGTVESSGVVLDASPYESHWATGSEKQRLESLERDNHKLQLKVAELTNQKMDLESNAEDMYEEVSRYEKEIIDLETQCNRWKKDFERLRKKNEDFKCEVDSLKVTVQKEETEGVEKKQLEDECDKLQDNNEEIRFVLDETKRHVEILAEENEDLKTKIDEVEAENAAILERQQAEAADAVKKLQNRIDVLEKEHDSYHEQLEETNSTLRKKSNRISNLVQTIEELKRGSSMLHSSKNDIEDQMGGMRGEIETLRYENEELEKTLEKLRKRASEEGTTKSIVVSTSSPQADANLEKEVEKLKKKVKKLEEQNQEYVLEMEDFAATNQSNFDQCSQLCEELGTLKDDFEDLNEEKLSLEQTLKHTEEEREKLQRENSIKRKSFNELTQECEDLSSHNEELTGVVSSLREKCLQLEVEKEDFSSEVKNLRANFEATLSENRSLSAKVESRNVDKLDYGGDEIDLLREECSDLQRINTDLQVRAQSVTKVQEEMFELQEENDRLMAENERLVKEAIALVEENRTLKEAGGQLKQTILPPHLQEAWKAEKVELEAEVQNLKDKIVILNHEMNILTKSKSQLESDKEEFQGQLRDVELKIDEIGKEKELLLTQNERLHSQIQELETENLHLESTQCKHVDYDQLKEQVSELHDQKGDLVSQLNNVRHLEVESVELRRDLNELNSLKGHSEEVITELQNENGRLQDMVNILQNNNGQIPQEVAQKINGSTQDYERKLRKLHEEVKRLRKYNKEADLKHREVVATYRTHLLSAVQGRMDQEVFDALQHILSLRTKTNAELISASSC